MMDLPLIESFRKEYTFLKSKCNIKKLPCADSNLTVWLSFSRKMLIQIRQIHANSDPTEALSLSYKYIFWEFPFKHDKIDNLMIAGEVGVEVDEDVATLLRLGNP